MKSAGKKKVAGESSDAGNLSTDGVSDGDLVEDKKVLWDNKAKIAKSWNNEWKLRLKYDGILIKFHRDTWLKKKLSFSLVISLTRHEN